MNYKNLPKDTRVWIYQSNRALTDSEVERAKKQGEDFILKWSAHGAKLNAAFEIFHNIFIVLFVDENQANASGCSIDKSVHFIKDLEKQFDVSLLDRNLVVYKVGHTITISQRNEFLDLIQNGELSKDTIVFDNLITNLGDFETKWQVKLKESWHTKMLEN